MAESFTIQQPLSILIRHILNNCKNIAQTFLARDCLLCGDRSPQAICDDCKSSLPTLSSDHCPHCAIPTTNHLVCGHCLSHPPSFEHTFANFTYSFPLDRLLQSLKYRSQLVIAPLLAQLMFERISIESIARFQPDLMIAMPLSKERLKDRGFNQSMEIARYLSRKTSIPLLKTGCFKVRETAHQTALPWKERAKNVHNAFVCEIDLSGKRIIVIDDVMTTGATLEEFALTLRKSGAQSVANWVTARTLPR